MAVPDFQAQHQGPYFSIPHPQMLQDLETSSNTNLFQPPLYSLNAQSQPDFPLYQHFHQRPIMSSDSNFTPPLSSSLPSSFSPRPHQSRQYFSNPSNFSPYSSNSVLSVPSPFSSGSSSSYPNDESPMSEPPFDSIADADNNPSNDLVAISDDFDPAYPEPAVNAGSAYSAIAAYPSATAYGPERADMFDFASVTNIPIGWPVDAKKPQTAQSAHSHNLQYPDSSLQTPNVDGSQHPMQPLDLDRLKSLFSVSSASASNMSAMNSNMQQNYDGAELAYPPSEWDRTPQTVHSNMMGFQRTLSNSSVKKEEERTDNQCRMFTSPSPFGSSPSLFAGGSNTPGSHHPQQSSARSSQHAFSMYGGNSGRTSTTMQQQQHSYLRAGLVYGQQGPATQERYVDPASVSPSMGYAQALEGGCNPRFVSGIGRAQSGSGSSLEGGSRGSGHSKAEEGKSDSDRDAEGEEEDAEGEEDADRDYQFEDDEEADGDGEYVLRRRSGSAAGFSSGPRSLRPRKLSAKAAGGSSRFSPYLGPQAASPPNRRASTSAGSTTRGRQTRTRQCTSLPVPIPVPNLTKKSRGRRVPTKFNYDVNEDTDEYGEVRGVRSYFCEVDGCGKCFARGEHLKRHIRSIHTHEKPHKCPYPGCGKDFSRHDNLGQHMRVHKDYSAPKNGLGLDLGRGLAVGARVGKI